MSSMSGKASTKKAQLAVVVTRADGRVDNYGVVASNSRWFRLIGRHLANRRINKLNRS